MKMRSILLALVANLMIFVPMQAQTSAFGSRGVAQTTQYVVELGGNAFITQGTGAKIDANRGLFDWDDKQAIIATYIGLGVPQQDVDMSIMAKGSGKIGVNVGGKTYYVQLNSNAFSEYNLGRVNIPGKGYQKIYFRGKDLGKDGKFGEVESIRMSGLVGIPTYVSHEDNYWGRRGPSAHIRYTLPRYKIIEYFYNEVTIPRGQDPVGSFFMSNGFDYGYLGLQVVKNPSDRRILFSVWSPYKTDIPSDVPEELQVKCVRAGTIAEVGTFGNEGSGAQVFVKYPWEVGKTYGFLTRIHPNADKTTDYSAWFYDVSKSRWHFIATLRRPKTSNWYSGAYSFVENFNPEMGNISRSADFSNTWVWDKGGNNAFELTNLHFTADPIGRKLARLDYSGRLTADRKAFTIKTGGFFTETTPVDSKFDRAPAKKAPLINFAALERLN